MSLAGEIFWMISKTYSVLFFLIALHDVNVTVLVSMDNGEFILFTKGISNAASDCQSFAESHGLRIVEFCSDTTLTISYGDDIVISGYNVSGTSGQCECQVEVVNSVIVEHLEFPKRGCGTVLKIQRSKDITYACGESEGLSFPLFSLNGQGLITLNKIQAPYDAAYCIRLHPVRKALIKVSCYSVPPAMLPTNPVISTSVSLMELERIDGHSDEKTPFNETKEEIKYLPSVSKCCNVYGHTGFVILASFAGLEFVIIAILACCVVKFRHPKFEPCWTCKTSSHDYVNENIGNTTRTMELYDGLGRREIEHQYDSMDAI